MVARKNEQEQSIKSVSDGESKNDWLIEIEDDSVFKHRIQLCAGIAGNVLKLANRAEISYSGTRNYFAGSEPSRDNLSRIARATGVRFEWLGEGTGPMRDLPNVLVQSVLHLYQTYCRQHSLSDARETRIRFVSQYNEGKIPTAENLQELLPKIAFVELRDWLGGIAPDASASKRDSEAAKHVPHPFIEDLYKDVGRVVEEYFVRRSENPSVAQLLDYTVRAYQIVYGTGIRSLSPECKEPLLSLLRLLDLGAAGTRANNTARGPENA